MSLLAIKWHWGSKDGGPESRVYMYGLEIKALFSILVLRFEDGSRDAYHSHAFNAISAILSGKLLEHVRGDYDTDDGAMMLRTYRTGRIVATARDCCHRVVSCGRTWVLSLRGPWAPSWTDFDGPTGVATVLTSGRVPQ